MSDSRRYTRSHTDGCTRRPKRDVQRYDSNSSRNSEIIRERPHRATAGVRKFADVHGSRDVGVSVAEKEGDFVDALAGQECSTGNRVPEAVHRWQRTVGNKDRMSILIDVAQDRECRVALRVNCSLLSVPECSADVPLLQRSAGPGREHIVIRPYEPRCEPMTRERHPELPRDRHRPRGSVRLGRLADPAAVDLPCELDLCVIEISDPDVRPGQS